MHSQHTVLLLIPHLGGGGAEQVTLRIAQGLSPELFSVHLALVTQQEPGNTALPCSVAVHGLNARRVLTGSVGLSRLVWKLKPDVILSGMFHLNFLVLLMRPMFPRKTRILVRQNCNPLHSSKTSRLPLMLRLYRNLYPRADGVICQTEDMAAELHALTGSAARIHVLPNPTDLRAIRGTVQRTRSRWPGPGPHLIAVGRLSHEKGFDLLLDAFAIVLRQFPTASLNILGGGPQESLLRLQADRLGLAQSAHFAGHVADPAVWFSGASLFVLASRHEGLPNALLEAAAAGLPIVSTPASRGLTALLEGRAGIWLTRDFSAAALAASMSAALSALSPHERFAHPWIEAFDLPRAIQEYESLILSMLAERNNEPRLHCPRPSRQSVAMDQAPVRRGRINSIAACDAGEQRASKE